MCEANRYTRTYSRVLAVQAETVRDINPHPPFEPYSLAIIIFLNIYYGLFFVT